MTLVASVDPGKKGYEAVVGFRIPPQFEAAPTHADPEGGPDLYVLPDMARLARDWLLCGVRLVVLEKQAPRKHGKGKFVGREGGVEIWVNGYGFGLWEMALAAAGFQLARVESEVAAALLRGEGPFYVVVDPLAWKRRMAATVGGNATKTERDRKTVEVAERLARERGESIDFRALERTPGARTPSADKCAAYLLGIYGLTWILAEGPRGA